MYKEINKTIFVFSDDCSDEKMRKIYVRGSFIIDSFDYLKFKEMFFDIKKEIFGENFIDKEFKYQYLWLKKKLEDNKNLKIKPLKEYCYVKYNKMLEFINKIFGLFNKFESIKFLFTYTLENQLNQLEKNDIINLYSDHLYKHVYRIDMDCKDENSIACFFFDYDIKYENIFRKKYNELIMKGDFYREYKNSKDSLNFEISDHSVGIQIADYISGCFKNFLLDYEESFNLFKDYIFKKIRTYKNKLYIYDDQKKEYKAYGVIEVPKNNKIRENLRVLIKNFLFNNINVWDDSELKYIYKLLDMNGYEINNFEYNLIWKLKK